MKNYLKIVYGSRGEIEEVKWFENKSFEEIVEIGKKEYEDYKEWILKEFKDDGEEEAGLMYIEEWCSISIKENVGIGLSLSEELGKGYYSEDVVSELVGLDLEDEKNMELLYEVGYRVCNIF